VRRDKLQAVRDVESRNEATNLSADVKPTAEEVAAAQALGEQVIVSAAVPPTQPCASPVACVP
jgi:hypothetical protein